MLPFDRTVAQSNRSVFHLRIDHVPLKNVYVHRCYFDKVSTFEQVAESISTSQIQQNQLKRSIESETSPTRLPAHRGLL